MPETLRLPVTMAAMLSGDAKAPWPRIAMAVLGAVTILSACAAQPPDPPPPSMASAAIAASATPGARPAAVPLRPPISTVHMLRRGPDGKYARVCEPPKQEVRAMLQDVRRARMGIR